MSPENNVEQFEKRAGFPWWSSLIQGISSLLIGILLITNTGATTLVIVQFVGIYWLISGIFSIVGIFIDKSLWGWKLFSGIIGIMAGISIMQHPLWSTLMLPTVLVIFLGIDGLIIGVTALIAAFKGGGWGIGILGGLSIFFGLSLLGSPFFAGLALPWILGIFAVVGGIAAIVFAIKQHKDEKAQS